MTPSELEQLGVRHAIGGVSAVKLLRLYAAEHFREVYSGPVARIADGDTNTVLVGKTQRRVRLEGIDCPERGQPYGKKAREFLSNLVAGMTVEVRPSGRVLDHIHVASNHVGTSSWKQASLGTSIATNRNLPWLAWRIRPARPCAGYGLTKPNVGFALATSRTRNQVPGSASPPTFRHHCSPRNSPRCGHTALQVALPPTDNQSIRLVDVRDLPSHTVPLIWARRISSRRAATCRVVSGERESCLASVHWSSRFRQLLDNSMSQDRHANT